MTRRVLPSALPAVITGVAAIVFSLVYFLSDLLELQHGGFSTVQLGLTYAAEATIPLFVVGLIAVQRPQMGALGIVSGAVYAYVFVFFTSTVVYALVDDVDDWESLQSLLSPWIGIHSVLMIVAGIGFGVAVARAEVLPRWTGMVLVTGMVLMAVTVGMPDPARTAAAAVRDLGFGAMGWALLTRPAPESPATSPPSTSTTHLVAEPESDPAEVPVAL